MLPEAKSKNKIILSFGNSDMRFSSKLLTILNEKLPYLYTINGNHAMGIGEVSYDELSSIELSVSVPNYQGNKYYKTSKRTKLRLKNSKKE